MMFGSDLSGASHAIHKSVFGCVFFSSEVAIVMMDGVAACQCNTEEHDNKSSIA